MKEKIKILIIEHDSNDVELIRFELDNGGINYESEIADSENEVIKALSNFLPDIILSDFQLPSFDGMTAFQLCQREAPLTPFIFVSGTVGEENAVELIKRGATDYALKDKLFSLPTKIIRALKESKEKREKVVAEEERIKVTYDLMQRNNDLEQFAYIVSHNLRAPVANILGFVDMFDIVPADEEQRKKLTNDLATSVKRLDTIIFDLNHILQIKDKANEKKETVHFSSLVADIQVSIANIIEKEGATVISNFSEAVEMVTLKGYLHSIFYNLITNSIKYRRPDVPPVIEIKSSVEEGKLKLVFKDNGLGIDMEKKGKLVFGLYKRFHPHIEGKGMGLFMVKTQVESLGGKISVTSEVDKGTEFKIVFENQ